jgi:3-isopropylmalate/(R)-2-methylmalate dehydratase small subunit
MEPFVKHRGVVMPLDHANVDTDAIIPKQFLKSVRKTGFGDNLFDHWRYLDHGEPGQVPSTRPRNPDFVLNHPRYQEASILLTRRNFGCGSSREHAVWALAEAGFRALIAPSYSEIFYNNCLKNGLLPIVLEEKIVDSLFAEVDAGEGFHITIDLRTRSLETATGDRHRIELDDFRHHCLLHGLNEIDHTLERAELIHAYESRRRREAPWLFCQSKEQV